MKQYIPNNFKLEEHLLEYPPENIVHFHKDNLIHILNLITEIPANRESYDSYNGFVPLNSTKLRKKVRNYKQYLLYLVNTGVFECDNQYIKGEKSKGYKFCERFTTKVKPEEVYKYTLVKKIKRERQIDEKVQKKYSYLINWFDNNLNIDYDGAYDFLESNIDLTLSYDKYIRKYNYSYRNINQFHDHDFYFSVDSSIQRFHSNFTRIRKDFRGFITYQEQPLVAVDISNSQPYLSIALFSKDFYIQSENEVNSFNLFNIHQLYPNSSLSSTISFTPPPMLYKILERSGNQDVNNYIELTQNGLIYEYLANEIKAETGLEIKERKDLKKIVFTVLFTANQFIGQPSAIYKRIFKDRFPTVYKVFSCLKKGQKEFLPRLLQRMESYMVLDRICKRISKERPQLPIYTIHDSVVTIKGNEGYVKTVMEEELEFCIGYKPNLKIEYWTFNKEW